VRNKCLWPNECEYVYRGVVYSIGEQCAGSSARKRQYFDIYFCKMCLEEVYKRLDISDCTYEKIKFDAHPRVGN